MRDFKYASERDEDDLGREDQPEHGQPMGVSIMIGMHHPHTRFANEDAGDDDDGDAGSNDALPDIPQKQLALLIQRAELELNALHAVEKRDRKGFAWAMKQIEKCEKGLGALKRDDRRDDDGE